MDVIFGFPYPPPLSSASLFLLSSIIWSADILSCSSLAYICVPPFFTSSSPPFSFLFFSLLGNFLSFSLFPLCTPLLVPFLILRLSLHTLLLFLMLFLWFLLACILLSIYNLVFLYLNLRSISHIFFVFYPVFLPCSSSIPLLQTAPRSLHMYVYIIDVTYIVIHWYMGILNKERN